MEESLAAKARRIKLVVSDIDGVWTDAVMYYTAEGEFMKGFSTRDGMAVALLRAAGIPTALITSEASAIVQARARKLGISDVFIGVRDKAEILGHLLEKYQLSPEEVAYIGDDINDLECMRVVGLSAAPADTPAFSLLQPDILLSRKGGEGAFRELADLILQVQKEQ